jgi:dTDP-4-amino-4,6-dideoxygalactose transaminase
MISLFKVFMSQDILKPVNETLMSGFVTQGPRVEELETKLQEKFNYPNILTLNSCTASLTLAVRLIKDKYGLDETSEILTVPLTCMATNEPIIANGLRLKWVDVDPETGMMDFDDLESKLNEKSGGVMIVHWGGYPANLDKLHQILERHYKKYNKKIGIIEDCAHAFGAKYKNDYVGFYGMREKQQSDAYDCFSCFSLQAIKTFTTGDGGLLICSNKEFHKQAKLLRWFGIDRDRRNYKGKDFRLEHNVESWGYKFHMNDINATIGLHNFPHIDELIAKQRANGQYLTEKLQELKLAPNVKILSPFIADDTTYRSSYWLFTILLRKLTANRTKHDFVVFMKSRGVMVSQVHERNDTHDCFSKYVASLPQLDELEKGLVCVPVGWWLTEDDLDKIVKGINDFICMPATADINE